MLWVFCNINYSLALMITLYTPDRHFLDLDVFISDRPWRLLQLVPPVHVSHQCSKATLAKVNHFEKNSETYKTYPNDEVERTDDVLERTSYDEDTGLTEYEKKKKKKKKKKMKKTKM